MLPTSRCFILSESGPRMTKNIAGHRIKIARTLHKPPISQADLLTRVQLLGLSISQPTLSKIERGGRPLTDTELLVFAKALDVDILWLLQLTEILV